MDYEKNDREHPARRGSTFTGILIGATAGGILALLLAPQSGQKTMKMLEKTATQLKGRAVDAVETARSQAMDTVESVRSQAMRVAGEASSQAKHALQAVKESQRTPLPVVSPPEKKSNTGPLLMGLLFGGTLGAIAALLTAPQSGKQTRTMIGEKAIQLKQEAASRTEGARHQAASLYETARGKAQDTLQSAKQSASKVAGTVKTPTKEELKEEVEILEEVHSPKYPL